MQDDIQQINLGWPCNVSIGNTGEYRKLMDYGSGATLDPIYHMYITGNQAWTL